MLKLVAALSMALSGYVGLDLIVHSLFLYEDSIDRMEEVQEVQETQQEKLDEILRDGGF
jgi:sensor domain CHASE-containing protein